MTLVGPEMPFELVFAIHHGNVASEVEPQAGLVQLVSEFVVFLPELADKVRKKTVHISRVREKLEAMFNIRAQS
jgi:hypothetical protein